ncbi:hypothetical protein DA89_3430 [Vibrio paracholerae]|nr:hypothetical protein DA89_3430 [Vibrio paracholerae]
MHFRPASITSHFEESTITGTLEISGSEAHRFKKRTMHASASNIPSSMLISMICAPFSTCSRATSSASSYCSSLIKRLKRAEPVTLVRSPTLTNKVSGPILSGSKPERRHSTFRSGRALGFTPSTALAMAAICSGVVPQQPPTKFKKPACAHSAICSAISSAERSYSPNALGSPAFGCAET